MSELITGRLNSQEAVKERQKATNYRIEAQDLRQQLRELHREKAPEQERERKLDPDRTAPGTNGTQPVARPRRKPTRRDHQTARRRSGSFSSFALAIS
ncbi:MAG: hypothetical protein WB630_07335 [Candidatus Acidiferrales bacterium]